ncbi:hypothetical protein R4Z09_07100 [Niallia oryzisoli]|uniref:YqgU-like 6-bladed beta-propeller domain-containing protein n=1 Tax=Niallia oryzisoli TaxID=1737571 RepID=A0ABZ2CLW0_9BACI
MCLLFVSTLLVIGCEKRDSSSQAIKNKKQPEDEQSHVTIEDVKNHLPILLKEGEFDKVYGWINNETIVYTTNIENRSNIYAYHLKTGTSTLLLKVESMIDSVHISHSGNYLLIRSSSEASPGKITVITNKGKEVFTTVIKNSFDAAIEWNPYDEDKVLISSFTADWQDRTFMLSIKNQKMTEIEVQNPFSYWLKKDKLISLNLDQKDQSNVTDVIVKDLSTGNETSLLSDVFELDSFQNNLLTIKADREQLNYITYTFYDLQLNQVGSLTMPGITSSLDWLIPYYDFNEQKRTFLSFQPLKSGAADSYKEGFQLIQYRLEDDTKTVMINGLENEPISCNQEGNLCLYGYYFEKLLDMKNKNIIQLVSNGE